MRTESSAALKFLYPVVVRVTGLCGVMLLIFTFLVFPRSTNTMELDEEVQIIIEQIDIPQTEQFDRPPPPARPSVPVESESEDIADDVTLDEFNLDEFVGPRFMIRIASLEMHPLDNADRIPNVKNDHGSGMCNITRCCTDVCPEHIQITDNGIIPLKERVVDRYYDPFMRLFKKLFSVQKK